MSQDFNNNPNQQQQIIVVRHESQALPRIITIFVPGIGQLVQGRIVAGLVWLLLWGLSIALTIVTIGLGLLVYIPMYILCIIDAATYKPGKVSCGLIMAGLLVLFCLILFLLFGFASAGM